nr:hypothetical protein CFP56_26105 [Quercus suber]
MKLAVARFAALYSQTCPCHSGPARQCQPKNEVNGFRMDFAINKKFGDVVCYANTTPSYAVSFLSLRARMTIGVLQDRRCWYDSTPPLFVMPRDLHRRKMSLAPQIAQLLSSLHHPLIE